MASGKISLSMMCAGIVGIEKIIQKAESAGIEFLHIDIMDGSFVPNITLGTMFLSELRQLSKIPIDLHLLIQDPEKKLDWFGIQKGDRVAVHWESSRSILEAVTNIQAVGAQAVVALNPGTPVSVLDEVIGHLDGVLLMMTNPGFSGRKLIESCIPKVDHLRKYAAKRGRDDLEIEVDGNVSFSNAKRLKKQGADIFVAGSSSIFSGNDFLKLTQKLRTAVK
ncbi:ribulose-phosphate 3-epimerase [Fibrobacterales bacterium]|nr:ribulose-phosphate 3-epimerase [Fibrobacterales bacterium]